MNTTPQNLIPIRFEQIDFVLWDKTFSNDHCFVVHFDLTIADKTIRCEMDDANGWETESDVSLAEHLDKCSDLPEQFEMLLGNETFADELNGAAFDFCEECLSRFMLAAIGMKEPRDWHTAMYIADTSNATLELEGEVQYA